MFSPTRIAVPAAIAASLFAVVLPALPATATAADGVTLTAPQVSISNNNVNFTWTVKTSKPVTFRYLQLYTPGQAGAGFNNNVTVTGSKTFTAQQTLPNGSYRTKVSYQIGDSAWQGGPEVSYTIGRSTTLEPSTGFPNVSSTPTSPTSTATTTTASTASWAGQYFNNATLSGTPATRTDAKIDFNWVGTTPIGPGTDGTLDSARWTQTADLTAGNYTFTMSGDDGYRVKVDNSLVLDEWRDQGLTTRSKTVPLTAGKHTIVVEYYEKYADGTAKFSYAKSSTTLTTTPTTSPTATPTATPTTNPTTTPTTSPTTAPVTGTTAPMALPSKVVGGYWMKWGGSAPRLANVSANYNAIYLAFATPAAGGGIEFKQTVQSQAEFAADVKTVRARGQRLILSIGGEGYSVDLSSANRQRVLDSIIAIRENEATIDGIDWDLEQANMDIVGMKWVSDQLKAKYGSNFAITLAPAGSNVAYKQLAKNLGANLDLIGIQYYDYSAASQAERCSGAQFRTSELINTYGIPAGKIGLGMRVVDASGRYTPDGVTSNFWSIEGAKSCWNTMENQYPTLRGAFQWEVNSDARLGNRWVNEMSPLIKN